MSDASCHPPAKKYKTSHRSLAVPLQPATLRRPRGERQYKLTRFFDDFVCRTAPIQRFGSARAPIQNLAMRRADRRPDLSHRPSPSSVLTSTASSTILSLRPVIFTGVTP